MRSFYRFPTQITTLDKIHSHRELKQKLVQEAIANGFQSYTVTFLKHINVMQHKNRYVYARCFYPHQRCGWRMLYKRRIMRPVAMGTGGTERGVQVWEQGQCYEICMERCNLYHGHVPFDYGVPWEKGVPGYVALWTSLHKYLQMPTMEIYWYSQAYRGSMRIPLSISRRRNDQIDIYLDELSFWRWVERTRQAQPLDILSYPNSNSKILPQLIALLPRTSQNLAARHGKVIGIKKIDPKILETSPSYNRYNALIFYHFVPGWGRLAYMFAVYEEGKFWIREVQFKEVFLLGLPEYGEGKKMPETRFARVNSNVVKICKLFLEILGSGLRTFVLQYDEEIIDSIQYLLDQVNKSRQKSHKISWILDPTLYFSDIAKADDLYTSKILHSLLQSSSSTQYQKTYNKHLQTLLTTPLHCPLHRILTHFHLHRKSLLPCYRPQPVYMGGWFQDAEGHQKCLELVIERCERWRPLVTVLDAVGLYMAERMRSWGHRSAVMMNFYYEKAFPFTFIKEARLNMVKKGFFMLLCEALEVNSVNFVSPWEQNREKGEPIRKIEREFDEIFRSEYLQMDDHSNLEARSKVPSQHPSITPLTPLPCPTQLPPQLQTYSQAYPLPPKTSITQLTPLPPYLQLLDPQTENTYICILTIHPQSWLTQYARNGPINSRVDPSFYRAQYKCSCGLREVKGIPCRHLLKICMRFGLPVEPYVEGEWKFMETKDQWYAVKCLMERETVPCVGRPKLSHRHNRKNYSPTINPDEGYYCQGQKLPLN